MPDYKTFSSASGVKLRKQTARDFPEFKACVYKWVGKYGLTDWRVTTENAGKNDDKFATVRYDATSRFAHFEFYWGGETTMSVERTACHEVVHLHVADLIAIAALRGYTHHDEVILEEHRYIERELNAMMGLP